LKSAGAKSVEALYTKVHSSIRATPEFKKVAKKTVAAADRKYKLPAKKLTKAQR